MFLIVAPAAHADPCAYTTRVVNVAIPNGPAMSEGVSSSVWVPPPFQPGDALEDVNIGVSVVTPDAKDVRVGVAHGATSVALTSRHGIGSATTFDDEAASPINGATAPFNGSFQPDQSLGSFDGQAAEGVWKLTVRDTVSPLAPKRAAGDQTFVSWTLTFAAANCADAQPPCDEHGTTYDIELPGTASGIGTSARVVGKGYVSDVDVYIGRLSSSGTSLSLAIRGPGTSTARKLVTGRAVAAGTAFAGTVFDDDATTAIASGAQPFTGRFKPEEALTTGAPVSGDYQFALSKTGSGSTATIGSWGLRVLTSGCVDTDGDVIYDASDNCEATPNVDQANYELDALGDVCDDDDDGDGVNDASDRCPQGERYSPTALSPDFEGDGCRDTEDSDDDDDGVADDADSCAQATKGPGGDTDGDGCKDFEDPDDDGDGVADDTDRCPLNADAGQVDTDGDKIGDACDPDDDGDGVIDSADAFPLDGTRTAPPTGSPPPGPSTNPTATAKAPRISGLKVSKRRIKKGKRATITYTVSASSTTRFTVFALKRCGKRKGCKPRTVRRRFTHADKAGAVRVVLKTKGLKKGRYRLQAVGGNAAGAGTAVSIGFRVR